MTAPAEAARTTRLGSAVRLEPLDVFRTLQRLRAQPCMTRSEEASTNIGKLASFTHVTSVWGSTFDSSTAA